MPNVMAGQPNIGGALCESSVIPFLVPRRKVQLTPAVPVPCRNAAKIGERKTWTQSEFCTWQNSVRRQEPPKMYVYHTSLRDGQTSCKVWLTSVEHRRCSNEAKTRYPLKYDGVPKPANRSQPIVGQSSPYYEDIWRRYRCFTSFFPIVDTCFICEDSPTNLCRGVQMAIFCVLFASCIFSEPRAAHFRHAF